MAKEKEEKLAAAAARDAAAPKKVAAPAAAAAKDETEDPNEYHRMRVEVSSLPFFLLNNSRSQLEAV